MDRMEPENQQGQPPSGPARVGSDEAGLHEKPGSGVSMPEWAESLQQDAPTTQSRLKVDLVARLRQEEAAAAARAKAARAAAEQVRREAAQRAAAAAAARKQAAKQEKKRVSKWPSALAALAVIIIGGFVGMAYQRAETEKETTPSPAPTLAATETASPSARPAVAPATYTVLAGDTLESIAERFGRTPLEISRVNGSTNRPISVKPGQVINLP